MAPSGRRCPFPGTACAPELSSQGGSDPFGHRGMRTSITLSLQLGKLWVSGFLSSPESSVGWAEAAINTDSQLGLPPPPSFLPQNSNTFLCADLLESVSLKPTCNLQVYDVLEKFVQFLNVAMDSRPISCLG